MLARVLAKPGYTGQLVGREALESSGVESLIYPVQRGIVKDWDAMELIFHNIFEGLKVQPKDRCIMLSLNVRIPDAMIEELSQMMFKTFCASALFIAKSAVLSLYATGHLDGVVVQIGDGITSIVPINQGYAVNENVIELPIGGRDFTEYMMQLLRDNGSKDIDLQNAKDVKERLCYFQLGNGKSAMIGKEKFLVPELFFKPDMAKIVAVSLQESIVNSVMKCDASLRANLFKKIFLTGGSAQFPGFKDRLQQEVSRLATGFEVNVLTPPDQKNSAWTGGVILGALDTVKPLLVNKGDYEKGGLSTVKEKCFFSQV
ncbi:hypothetical protein KUTeg_010894 [Tegillarca granosa]|uniref:Uncharacterized protein n=1 Tax=Tegillarca granosa TaxID=220873 RepID=A0ABQ9F2B1_TEGGR|nr:hypothetical protein KUTeg_010894 [Tegillarca granosa]